LTAAPQHPLMTPFVVAGVVERGDQRGRTLGMPTANVAVERDTDMPPEGVYAAVVTLADGSRHPAAVSLGRRPTFYADGFELCEAHLLDFEGDLYGERAEVRFTHFLRSERKFNGIDALITQLKHDIEHARIVLDAQPS
jgi:riboflavin kinase / FMN adenylyltransferase